MHDEVDRQLHRLALTGVADPDDPCGEGATSTGVAASTSAAAPEAMTSSCPAATVATLPDTGESTNRRPDGGVRASRGARAASTPLVPRSHTTASGRRASRTSRIEQDGRRRRAVGKHAQHDRRRPRTAAAGVGATSSRAASLLAHGASARAVVRFQSRT